MADDRVAGTVVVGVVDAEGQHRVVRLAAEEAERRGTGLRILHAVEWPLPSGTSGEGAADETYVNRAERVTAPFAATVMREFPQLSVAVELVTGSPTAALVDRSEEAALIVLGHRGTGGFARLPLGSVSLQVATHAACPVVVARPGGRAERDNRVVVGVDVHDVRPAVLDFALHAAAIRGAALDVLHASTAPSLLATGPAGPLRVGHETAVDAEQDPLEEVVAPFRAAYPDLEVRVRAEHGHPARVLVDAARRAELLVVGTHGRTGLKRLLLGSVSGEVLHAAECTVAVVPAER
ncbi:universal stress protein [Streptomyces sanyensis]|uniref:Universal stress protein n=1 Tax=Streptomyces sanyensis TaxID=568869 RepID=A0ABP9B035_9ACTN